MKLKEKMDNLNIKKLDHLGIVAGIIDEMGLVEIINEKLGTHLQEAHIFLILPAKCEI